MIFYNIICVFSLLLVSYGEGNRRNHAGKCDNIWVYLVFSCDQKNSIPRLCEPLQELTLSLRI